MIHLVSVYGFSRKALAIRTLYKLLGEREPHECISHKRMPTLEQHTKFVESMPYQEWYLITDSSVPVGGIYLTNDNEIGVGILRDYRNRGFAREAVLKLQQMHVGERLLANVAPGNEASHAMFRDLGFRCIQHTYALEPVR